MRSGPAALARRRGSHGAGRLPAPRRAYPRPVGAGATDRSDRPGVRAAPRGVGPPRPTHGQAADTRRGGGGRRPGGGARLPGCLGTDANSVSAAPTGTSRLTVKALGDGTGKLQNLAVGTRVIAEGPYGRCHLCP